MERPRPPKKRLSSNILEMKFMKRTKEKAEIERENEERQEMFKNQISNAMRHQGSRFLVDPSYASVESLCFGRMSFYGMNPEIEKMAENERIRQEEEDAERNEKDVQDEDMAHFYSRSGSTANTVGRKFATKREYSVQSGGQNRPMHILMSNSEAINRGEDILNQGANLIDNMKSQNRTWRKDQKLGAQSIGKQTVVGAESAKRPRFMKPPSD